MAQTGYTTKIMQKLIVVSFLFLSLFSQSQDYGWLGMPERWMEYDKQAHVLGGAWTGVVGYNITYSLMKTDDVKKKRRTSKLVSIGFGILVGSLKEWNDVNQGGKFDFADIGYTVGGNLLATYTFDILRNKKQKKK